MCHLKVQLKGMCVHVKEGIGGAGGGLMALLKGDQKDEREDGTRFKKW
jgi:hypothetical protein